MSYTVWATVQCKQPFVTKHRFCEKSPLECAIFANIVKYNTIFVFRRMFFTFAQL